MARTAERLNPNIGGDFYVEPTCIDCDTCRQVAPEVFGRSHAAAQSYVLRQPGSPDDLRRAAMALVACPTGAIGTSGEVDLRAAARSFPEEIEDGVYYCGFACETSFGAASYFIRRPGGNVLVDSPRPVRALVERLTELGGVRTMFLTHRDDAAEHEHFQRLFGCERILHLGDVSEGTYEVERKLEGHDPIELAPDLLAIPVPGHTRGSTALLYREKFLFSGDHVLWSPGRNRLSSSRAVCWHSWAEQVSSLRRLLEYRFQWILPAHGRRYRAPSEADMREQITSLLRRL